MKIIAKSSECNTKYLYHNFKMFKEIFLLAANQVGCGSVKSRSKLMCFIKLIPSISSFKLCHVIVSQNTFFVIFIKVLPVNTVQWKYLGLYHKSIEGVYHKSIEQYYKLCLQQEIYHMACCMIIVRWQEVSCNFHPWKASATTADCAMKFNHQTIFIIAVTALVFLHFPQLLQWF